MTIYYMRPYQAPADKTPNQHGRPGLARSGSMGTLDEQGNRTTRLHFHALKGRPTMITTLEPAGPHNTMQWASVKTSGRPMTIPGAVLVDVIQTATPLAVKPFDSSTMVPSSGLEGVNFDHTTVTYNWNDRGNQAGTPHIMVGKPQPSSWHISFFGLPRTHPEGNYEALDEMVENHGVESWIFEGLPLDSFHITQEKNVNADRTFNAAFYFDMKGRLLGEKVSPNKKHRNKPIPAAKDYITADMRESAWKIKQLIMPSHEEAPDFNRPFLPYEIQTFDSGWRKA